jgi:hypothetical protein
MTVAAAAATLFLMVTGEPLVKGDKTRAPGITGKQSRAWAMPCGI